MAETARALAAALAKEGLPVFAADRGGTRSHQLALEAGRWGGGHAMAAGVTLASDRLAEFRPHLTGAVWRGTATRLNSIHLQLFCDDAKEAEIELLNRRIDFDVGSLNGPRNQPIDVLSFSTACAELGEPVTLHLSILDFDDLRGALKADTRGRTERGDLAALRRLLDVEAT